MGMIVVSPRHCLHSQFSQVKFFCNVKCRTEEWHGCILKALRLVYMEMSTETNESRINTDSFNEQPSRITRECNFDQLISGCKAHIVYI